MKSKPIVAAFDFDGTITTRDALVSFLLHTVGKVATMKKLAKLSPQFTGYLLSLQSRQDIKDAILTEFFAGMPRVLFEAFGEAFAASSAMQKLIRPEAQARIDWHLKQNHQCLIVSAGIETYIKPWGKLHGFTDTLASQPDFDSKDRLTGKLKGLNCWGPEKIRRLAEFLGSREDYILYAYGDTRGDKELLAYADFAFYREMPTF